MNGDVRIYFGKPLARLAHESSSGDEPALNRALCLAIDEVSYKLIQSGEEIPPVIYEGRNSPDSLETEPQERERKIPDFQWSYYDQHADQGAFRKSFVVECKRLTTPSAKYSLRYVNLGVARFVNVEHGYGYGMVSGAMVGYLQKIQVDDAVARINTVAAADDLPPLTLGERNGDTAAEFEHDLDRSFPQSPFHLTHFWARIGNWSPQ